MQIIPIVIDASGTDGEASDPVEKLAHMFRALGDPNRLRLLFSLMGSGTGQSVGEASGCCAVDLSVVSRHLKQLEEAGILTREKLGKEVVYKIDSEQLPGALSALAKAVSTCCPDSTTATDKE